MHIFDTTYLVLIVLPFLMFSVFYSSVIDLSTIEQFIAALISQYQVLLFSVPFRDPEYAW